MTASEHVIVDEDRAIGDAGAPGRPPLDWLVDPDELIAALEAGVSVREAARRAGVHPRTLVRVFWSCGYSIARLPRDPAFTPLLPAERVHHAFDLARQRRALRALNPTLGAVGFAEAVSLPPQSADRLAARLDDIDARGQARVGFEPLPGHPLSDRQVTELRGPAPYRMRGSRRTPRERQAPPTILLALTPQEVARRYGAGETIASLAEAVGCSSATLTRRMKAWGIEIRPRGPRPNNYGQGHSL